MQLLRFCGILAEAFGDLFLLLHLLQQRMKVAD